MKLNKKRDATKLKKSKLNNVEVKIWHYSKIINEKNVKELIEEIVD